MPEGMSRGWAGRPAKVSAVFAPVFGAAAPFWVRLGSTEETVGDDNGHEALDSAGA